MKKWLITSLLIGFFISHQPLSAAFRSLDSVDGPGTILPEMSTSADLKNAAFKILDAKCNVCHKKQNPFKVFSIKNMDKNARKIHKQVFVLRRMPKGDQTKLTDQEYDTLNQWLKSKNIY